MAKALALNKHGRRIGETHPRATVSNAVVREMYVLADFYQRTPTQIARQLGLSVQYVSRVLLGKQRGQVAVRWRRAE